MPETAMTAPIPALWVSVEGVEGAGKTYLAQRLARLLGPGCLLVSEVTDHRPQTMEGRIVAALSACGDLFLRTGHPAAETLALLALKARAHSEAAASALPHTQVVLEDRGPDTVAVYQALILHPDGTEAQILDTAQRILAFAGRWRPLPDVTLLITDDPGICEERFAARTGRPVEPPERRLMRSAAQLYEQLAAAEAARYKVISRQDRTTGQALADMAAACRPATAGRARLCVM
jgi:dTMP kinase